MERPIYRINSRNRSNSIMPPFNLIICVVLFSLAMASLASGEELDNIAEDNAAGRNISLDVYLYNTGKTLVTGYADSVDGMTFLKPAQYITQYIPSYRYEKDTCELYAWTDALTSKQGENWTLAFTSWGYYNECHIIFHLPANLRLRKIDSSKGLDYLVSASNDSIAVDVQGYNVRNPSISMKYRQLIVIEDDTSSELIPKLSKSSMHRLIV
jgi:hypothetical protein